MADDAQLQQSKTVGRAKRREWPFVLGLVLTLSYFLLLLFMIQGQTGDFAKLAPNEVGDFLAGAFAPLAFLWLVLGFIQQGYELRNSAEALWLQGEELRNSVEQQRELVSVTREQLAFEAEMLTQQRDEIARNSQPVLRLVPTGNAGSDKPNGRRFKFRILNLGKPCTDASVMEDGKLRTTSSTLGTGERLDFEICRPTTWEGACTVEVSYLDGRLLRGVQRFEIRRQDAKISITGPHQMTEVA